MAWRRGKSTLAPTDPGATLAAATTALPAATAGKSAWREAAHPFLLSRGLIVFLTYVATAYLPLSGQTIPQDTAARLLAWYHWDAVAYIRVAQQGYSISADAAFFPLWPALVHALGMPFGATPTAYYWAALLLSNACFYGVLVLLYHLLSGDFTPTTARRALYYLALYPYALFFFAGYTESLFLLLCLAVFVLMRRDDTRSWWLAGGAGFLAALTRPTGIVLVIPLAVAAVQRFWLSDQQARLPWWRKLAALAPAALVPAGVGAYMVYLGVSKGNPLLFSVVELANWHRYSALPGTGIILAIQAIGSSAVPALNALDLIFTLLPLGVLAAGWKRLPPHYTIFAVCFALLTLSLPVAGPEPLASAPRYLMVIFPVFVIAAHWGEHPRVDRLVMAVSPALLAVNVALFVSHYWVA
jgi:mannosyltransferase PIG-V